MTLTSALQVKRVHPDLMDRTFAQTTDIKSVTRAGTKELFGVDVEIEGRHCHLLAGETPASIWRAVRDDSLRGESIELVSPIPSTITEVEKACNFLSEKFRKFDTSFMSDRTSVHVHYNVSAFTVRDLHKSLVGWYLLENALTRKAGGQAREGNKFCLRTCDSETPLQAIIKGFQSLSFYPAIKSRKCGRYSNLNLMSLLKFGTLEVRCHKGSVDGAEILMWVQVLREVFGNSRDNFGEASEIMIEYSALGAERFLKEHYPRVYEYLADVEDWQYLIEDCLDYAQSLAYCIQEDEQSPKTARWSSKKKSAGRLTPSLSTTSTSLAQAREQVWRNNYAQPEDQ